MRDNGDEGAKRFLAYHDKSGNYRDAITFFRAEFSDDQGNDFSREATRNLVAQVVDRFQGQIIENLDDREREFYMAEIMQNIADVNALAAKKLITSERADRFDCVVRDAVEARVLERDRKTQPQLEHGVTIEQTVG